MWLPHFLTVSSRAGLLIQVGEPDAVRLGVKRTSIGDAVLAALLAPVKSEIRDRAEEWIKRGPRSLPAQGPSRPKTTVA